MVKQIVGFTWSTKISLSALAISQAMPEPTTIYVLQVSKNLSLDLNLWLRPGQWSSVLRKLIRSSDDLVFKITLVKEKI